MPAKRATSRTTKAAAKPKRAPIEEPSGATMADVAAGAGVSVMTVSRVVNGDPRVRPATGERVRATMASLGYVPPAPEQDGRRRRSRSGTGLFTKSIALLFPDVNVGAAHTALSGRLIDGASVELGERGLRMVLARLEGPQTLPDFLERRHVDGVVVRGNDGWIPKRLGDLPAVYTFGMSGTERLQADHVVVDNVAAGEMACEHLVKAGRRRLVAIDFHPDHPEHRARGDAFVAAAKRAGVSVEVERHGDEGDYLRACAALAKRAKRRRPDGWFIVGSGFGVPNCLQICHEQGVVIGDDLDVVPVCHDRSIVGSLHPRLANIDICPEEISRVAVQTLLARLASPGDPTRQIMVTPRLELPQPLRY